MKLLLSFHITFACLFQIHFSVARSVKNYPSVDCSEFHNDDDVRLSFPFPVEDDPVKQDSTVTYAKWNNDHTVRKLYISGDKTIPPSIFCLKSLEELHIRGNNFHKHSSHGYFVHRFPAGIRNFARTLTVLDIQNSHLTYLPDEIGLLTKLIGLEISNASLVSLPDTIGDLPLLSKLYVPDNKLSSLPATLKKNSKLLQVVVSGNPKLRSLEPLNDHPSLEMLKADGCAIDQLSLRLPMLHDLSMTNNKLENINHIKRIGYRQPTGKKLNFAHNQIQSISRTIHSVKNLTWLNLNGNQLNNLPEDIFRMTNLTYLDIRSNAFGKHLDYIVDKFNRTNPTLKLKY